MAVAVADDRPRRAARAPSRRLEGRSRFDIRSVSLDDSTASSGFADEARTAQNARRAATAVAHHGEFDSYGRRPTGRGPSIRTRSTATTAIALALDALTRAGDTAGDRAQVVRSPSTTGVLGAYSIHANGDTTLREDGVYRIRRGLMTYSGKIVA